MSMYDVLMAVIFMVIVFGTAAGFLLIMDRWMLRKKLSEQERSEALEKRAQRFVNGWSFFFFLMAFISLFMRAFNLKHESVGPRVTWFLFAAFVVLGYLSRTKSQD